MQTEFSTDTERTLAVELILEDIPGGGVVEKDDFPADATEMKEGALLAVAADGIYHVVKTATVNTAAASGDTSILVNKGHSLKVGSILSDTGKTYTSRAITVIDTTSATGYDTLTIAAAFGVAPASGAVLIGSSATGASGTAFKYTPIGIATNPVDLTVDNTGCGIMVRGRVRESLLPYPVDATIKALLPLIRFV